MGSARSRGNTDLLLDSAIAGAKDAGAEVEKVVLHELNMDFCDGCYSCARASYCVKHPTVNGILEKIRAADGIIMASPAWWFSVSSHVKTLIDHWICFCDPATWESRIPGKKVGLISVAAMPKTEGVAEKVIAYMASVCEWLGMSVVARMPVYGMNLRGEVINHPDLMRGANQLGQRVALACKNGAAQSSPFPVGRSQ